MNSKITPEPSKRDEVWQKKIEKRLKNEDVKLGHPKGKERFNKALRLIFKLKD